MPTSSSRKGPEVEQLAAALQQKLTRIAFDKLRELACCPEDYPNLLWTEDPNVLNRKCCGECPCTLGYNFCVVNLPVRTEDIEKVSESKPKLSPPRANKIPKFAMIPNSDDIDSDA